MGTIAQYFESGEQSANKGYFKNLVMLARVDGKVDDTEIHLLARMAKKLSLTEAQVKEIIEHAEDYPMVPPVSKEERYERFVQFIEMTYVDGQIDANEEALVQKYGIALGMPEEELENNYPTIVEQVKAGKAHDEIVEGML